MDEEEFRKYANRLSGTINVGAAGALGNPIYKKDYPTNVSSNLFNVQSPGTPVEELAIPGDVIEGDPSLYDRLFGLTERIDAQGNTVPGWSFHWDSDTNLPVFHTDASTILHSITGGDNRYKQYEDMSPIQRWAFDQQYKYAQDPVGELLDKIPLLGLISEIPFVDSIIPNISEAEGFKFDPEVEAIEIPEYTPYDPGEFEYGHWTELLGGLDPETGRYRRNPEYGGRHNDGTWVDYHNLTMDLVDKGIIEGYTRPEWAALKSEYGTPGYGPAYKPGVTHTMVQDHVNDWFDSHVPAVHAEEERKWQLEYDAAKEAFDRRNEEEERRHREEYDKMVADMLAEQELEASMDTDFSMGDLEQDDFWTKLDKLLDATIYNPVFNAPPDNTGTDGWNEPAESTPPSWLSVPSASTDPLNLDNALSWNNRVSPKVLNVEPSAQDIMDWNPGLFTPTNQFNTTIPNPALENMYNDPGAANKALDVLIPPLS